ncbi:MAG: ABC transporter substrate-binding protein [Alphaproteobacteria bacterium]|nr:ABC transporter substrate-binding protein [Alphaproteobacteria bacterium]MCB9929209.1 ABC transporter substrate-binding protein [Alphaproteobacteria bacterium]
MVKTLSVVAATAAILVGAQAQAKDIKIGVLYPTSGGGAIYGVPAMEGHNMAVDEINAAGGVGGAKLVTFARDTKLNPSAAAAAAKELITKEGVDVLVGGLSSAVGLAISEVAKQEGVVYIATIPKTIQMTTTKLHKYVFRTASNTDFEGDAMAQLVHNVGGKKLCDIQLDYAYGYDLAKGIEDGLKRHAPEVQKVMDLRAKLGATDYNAQITQILGAGCDVVTSGLWGAHFVNFAQQAKPFGLFNTIKFISGGEVASHEITGKMGDDYPDNVWSNAYELWYDDTVPAHKTFHDELSKRSGTKETAMWPVLAYIGVKFVAAGVEKAGSADPDALSAALEGMSIDTPVGQRTINPKDHQANTGQFWGPLVKKEGFAYRVMSPVTYIPAEIAE